MVLILINFTILGTSLILIYLLIQGAIYVPSSDKAIKTMLDLADLKPGDRIADLGSGDGRVVMAFAKKGAEIHGFELNPLLVFISRRKIKKENLEKKALIHWGSFWKTDLSRYNVIIVFGIDFMMRRLKKKLRKELKPGSIILSNIFSFPDWPYVKKKNGVYLYKT